MRELVPRTCSSECRLSHCCGKGPSPCCPAFDSPEEEGGGNGCTLSHPEERIIWRYGGRVPKPAAADWTVSPVPQLHTLKWVDQETGVGSLAEVTLLLSSLQQLPFPQLWQPKIWPGIECPVSLWDPS